MGRHRTGEHESRARAPGEVAALLGLIFAGCLGAAPPLGGGTSESSGSSSSSTSTSAAPDSSGGLTQTAACADYLECLAADEPALLPEAELEFGPAGTCWADATTAEQCDATCVAETEQRCATGSGDGTGEEPLKCSIEALVPGARSPVQAGDGAALLPVAIGDALERNCGCHYVDSARLDPEVPAYNGAMRMSTWEEFHTPFMGTLTYLRVEQRAVVQLGMPPPFYCDDLDMGSLSTADYTLLQAWLDAGAPDAARWGG